MNTKNYKFINADNNNILNNTTKNIAKMDSIILDLLHNINNDDLDYIHYHSTKINIDYNDIINIWFNFINKNVLELPDKNMMDLTLEPVKSSLRVSLFEHELSVLLEKLFKIHMNCIGDDLLVFYIKGKNNLLLLYKSYTPLLQSENIQLPYWEYILEHPNIMEKFKLAFDDTDNLCIMGFSI